MRRVLEAATLRKARRNAFPVPQALKRMPTEIRAANAPLEPIGLRTVIKGV